MVKIKNGFCYNLTTTISSTLKNSKFDKANNPFSYLLEGNNSTSTIFNFFENNDYENIKLDDMVGNQNEQHVEDNHKHFSVIAYDYKKFGANAEKIGCYISIEAVHGKEEELGDLLLGAVDLIKATEPGTLFWAALRFSHSHFGIFDTFTTIQDQEKHFAGLVAQALKKQASTLVSKGWEGGILPNVIQYKIKPQYPYID